MATSHVRITQALSTGKLEMAVRYAGERVCVCVCVCVAGVWVYCALCVCVVHWYASGLGGCGGGANGEMST